MTGRGEMGSLRRPRRKPSATAAIDRIDRGADAAAGLIKQLTGGRVGRGVYTQARRRSAALVTLEYVTADPCVSMTDSRPAAAA